MSSSSSESSCDDEVDEVDDLEEEERGMMIVLHMDVDYFYGQCEEIDGDLDRHRPIAVGQKHIVVTCNYVARSYGVKKLMLRSEATKKCPALLILEGSDLQRYRKHSHRIYATFRTLLHALAREYSLHSSRVPITKGGMDEAFCDMTALVQAACKKENMDQSLQTAPSNAYIYGEESYKAEEPIVLTEDQTGAQSILHPLAAAAAQRGDSSIRNDASKRHHYVTAAVLAERVRNALRQQAGFTTSMGISSSPMLAKLASSLKKPNALSILVPWRAMPLIQGMPLRKVPQLGHATYKALLPCLQNHCNKNRPADNNNKNNSNDANVVWTCRDLTFVPRHEVLECLRTIHSSNATSEAQCDDLLQKCRGMDTSQIMDDSGGLSKTLSVENSFRRHTVCTKTAVWEVLEDLLCRLPRLLTDRRDCSPCPSRCYPTTIKLTAAVVDFTVQKRKRPFATRSKQMIFDGRGLLVPETNATKRSDVLRKAVTPLVNALVLSNGAINLVRLNIAITGFQDLAAASEPHQKSSPWAGFTSKTSDDGKSTIKRQKDDDNDSQSTVKRSKALHLKSLDASARAAVASKTQASVEMPSSDDIDPAVLAELPADIRAEVYRAYKSLHPVSSKRRMDQFFTRK